MACRSHSQTRQKIECHAKQVCPHSFTEGIVGHDRDQKRQRYSLTILECKANSHKNIYRKLHSEVECPAHWGDVFGHRISQLVGNSGEKREPANMQQMPVKDTHITCLASLIILAMLAQGPAFRKYQDDPFAALNCSSKRLASPRCTSTPSAHRTSHRTVTVGE